MSANPIQVVVIDDDEDDFFLIKSLLTEVQGPSYETQWVSSSELAVETIKLQKADVYLMDYRLGAKTGLDILDELQGLELKKPIILLTGQIDRSIDLAAMRKGAADFLSKKQITSDLLERSIRYSIKQMRDQEKLKEAAVLKIEKEAAEVISHAKNQFLANMSHEIRTPLGAILAFAELALDPTNSEKEKTEFVGNIKRNGEHLLELVNDILDLSMVESGNIKIVSEDFLWRSVVNDVIQLLKPKATLKGVALNYRIIDKSAEFFKSDSHRFRQILVNLVGNAIKFTDSGKIDISCEAKLDTKNSTCDLIVSVQDTGIGISPDEQIKLFQPFEQANPKLTRKYGGTGLGLDLSRKFARAIGGDIVITQSTPGVGSVFTLTLPGYFRAYQSGNENKPSISQGPLDPAVLCDFKVLLVEDCIDNQVIVKHFLKDTGCELDMAINGREGVEKALAKDFDIVLMDIQMPVMDGYEATQQLRQGGYKKPIIALTAHALNEEREKALRSGFSDYLTKPIQRRDLVATLSKYKNKQTRKIK